ncbi:hypothetical protein BDV26DRAFT_275994 [Aspergillus bertholletiae]|uniref:C2H2-type domain-containing protein n=1 Tax=Aspergillus bertholletiae TaxID=1226010 RepID=A0A5N7ANQ0_9EURO|nr:hypothetical protein BDV26DRAFT_275994 [Aspergillus bertholletiae]
MHVRPFKCDVAGCSLTTGFPYKKDLKRHQRDKHTDEGGAYYCPYSWCNYSRPQREQNGRKGMRHDNYMRHMKKVHYGFGQWPRETE